MQVAAAAEKWWIRTGDRARPRVRLFCFPYAGGAATMYGSWAAQFGEGVEIASLQLPGREVRLREPLVRSMTDAVTAVVPSLADDDVPYCFFGYSLGALIAFETIRALRRAGRTLPARLFVAAASAPQRNHARTPPIHRAADEQFYDELRKFQGTPEAVLKNVELMSVILPMLRGDFELLETYQAASEPPLPVPISAFGGLADGEVSAEAVAEWGEQTSAGFTLQFFPGDHFFIRTAVQTQLIERVRRELDTVARPRTQAGSSS